MRHLVTHIERPTSTRRAGAKGEGEGLEEVVDEVDVYDGPYDEEEDEVIAVIDESESEAAPRAID